LNKDEIDWLKLPNSNITSTTQDATLSERQQFESNPSGYLKTIFEINNKSKWPQLIVGFGGTMEEVDDVLKKYEYREKTRLGNCLVLIDGHNECSVSVYERQPKTAG
jgi:hypothetical protein